MTKKKLNYDKGQIEEGVGCGTFLAIKISTMLNKIKMFVSESENKKIRMIKFCMKPEN